LVIGTALAVFVIVCLLPPIQMLIVSLHTGAGRQSALAALVLDARQRELLVNSAMLGAGTAFVATLIGVPLGIALARIPLRRKAVLRLALAAPVLLPPS
jgi:ABC-type Fe3+ transport system permease subunit